MAKESIFTRLASKMIAEEQSSPRVNLHYINKKFYGRFGNYQTIQEVTVSGFTFLDGRVYYLVMNPKELVPSILFSFSEEQIGQSVFLTLREAEVARKKKLGF